MNNIKNIKDLISIDDTNLLIKYINSPHIFDFEKEYLEKLEGFEKIYNDLFLEKKKKFL